MRVRRARISSCISLIQTQLCAPHRLHERLHLTTTENVMYHPTILPESLLADYKVFFFNFGEIGQV